MYTHTCIYNVHVVPPYSFQYFYETSKKNEENMHQFTYSAGPGQSN